MSSPPTDLGALQHRGGGDPAEGSVTHCVSALLNLREPVRAHSSRLQFVVLMIPNGAVLGPSTSYLTLEEFSNNCLFGGTFHEEAPRKKRL